MGGRKFRFGNFEKKSKPEENSWEIRKKTKEILKNKRGKKICKITAV